MHKDMGTFKKEPRLTIGRVRGDEYDGIVLICAEDGNICIYTENLGCETLKAFYEKATGKKVNDVIVPKQSEIQYYCIDDRMWLDEKDEQRIIEFINNNNNQN